jgi:hypothetical protein
MIIAADAWLRQICNQDEICRELSCEENGGVIAYAVRGMAMRHRRWISLIALVGVFLHTGAIVYHHQVMLDAHLARQQLLDALTVLCHGGGSSSGANQPALPIPSEQSSGCLVCKGLISPFALIAAQVHFASPDVVQSAVRPRLSQGAIVGRVAHARPPVRGPPRLI